ncbi:hypothetical protein EYF80_020803 [Liparis tanakae]|uniref:Uncharacterized protein n=1 Tax=Liparis tanakae TaxID=230148 RepID=A0A4Z2HVK7_9TELE|nr:hypothetical protein EYF80_020803 [Liparis tanakae]
MEPGAPRAPERSGASGLRQPEENESRKARGGGAALETETQRHLEPQEPSGGRLSDHTFNSSRRKRPRGPTR